MLTGPEPIDLRAQRDDRLFRAERALRIGVVGRQRLVARSRLQGVGAAAASSVPPLRPRRSRWHQAPRCRPLPARRLLRALRRASPGRPRHTPGRGASDRSPPSRARYRARRLSARTLSSCSARVLDDDLLRPRPASSSAPTASSAVTQLLRAGLERADFGVERAPRPRRPPGGGRDAAARCVGELGRHQPPPGLRAPPRPPRAAAPRRRARPRARRAPRARRPLRRRAGSSPTALSRASNRRRCASVNRSSAAR